LLSTAQRRVVRSGSIHRPIAAVGAHDVEDDFEPEPASEEQRHSPHDLEVLIMLNEFAIPTSAQPSSGRMSTKASRTSWMSRVRLAGAPAAGLDPINCDSTYVLARRTQKKILVDRQLPPVTSIRHSGPALSFPSNSLIISPQVVVASSQAASSLGSSIPSSASRGRSPCVMLKK
jgi:hypothetical protein